MSKSKLSSLFYVYSELSVAVFFGAMGLIELVCGAALAYLGVHSVALLASGAGVLFIIVALSFSVAVYRKEKKGF